MRRGAGREGFTLIEMLISLTILAIVGVTFSASMRSMASLATAGTTRASIQREGSVALERILVELRQAGFVTQGGFDYPHLFDDGAPGLGFEAHAHAVPAGAAVAGDYDFGVTREIVFLVPADADGDSEPDVDANGDLAWGADEISYVLDQNAAGERALERRVNGGAPETIATGVERIVFDNAASSGWEIPLSAVRVQLFFRVQDNDGSEVRYSVEGMTRLRNG